MISLILIFRCLCRSYIYFQIQVTEKYSTAMWWWWRPTWFEVRWTGVRQPVEERPGEGCNGKHCPHDDVHVGDDEKSIADKRLLANLQRVRSKKEEFLDEASFLMIGVVVMQPHRLLAKSATCSIKMNKFYATVGREKSRLHTVSPQCIHRNVTIALCNHCLVCSHCILQHSNAIIAMRNQCNISAAYCRYLLNIALCIKCAQCSLCELSFALYAVQWSAL